MRTRIAPVAPIIYALATLAIAAPAAAQIVAGQIDVFGAGDTEGWGVGFAGTQPTSVADAGPEGSGDFALRAQSFGSVGANSALVLLGTDPSWTGDYTAAGIGSILVDVNNTGATDLDLRIALRGASNGEWWVTPSVPVQAMSGWFTVEFPVRAADLIAATDSGASAPMDVDGTLANVGAIRILHATNPTRKGDSIVASLDLDNIEPIEEIRVGKLSDFEDATTQGWTVGAPGVHPAPPTVVADAGPMGTGDDALRLTADGFFKGAGGRLVVFNEEFGWTGDFTAAGVAGIELDLNNTSMTPLEIRIALEGGTTDEWWVSAPTALAAMSGWTTRQISLLPGDLTAAIDDSPGADVNGTLANVVAIRILHSSTATLRGEPVDAVLDVDNIEAVPEPSAALAAAAALGALVGLRRRSRA